MTKPLEGLKVIELGQLIAGPFAGKFFSEFGADVDWDRLTREGPAWMSYWDQHVRGTGRRAAP